MIGGAILGIVMMMAGMGVLMGACQAAFTYLPNMRQQSRDITATHNYWLIILLNVIAVFATYIGAVLIFPDLLIRTGPSHWYEVVVPVLLYDFAYYWLHRLMHTKFLMRHLHGWHHLCKHPTALDGLYQRPHETMLALAMLMGCVAIVGPVGVTAFVLVIFFHTLINMLDHANLKTGLRWLDHIMKAHDMHHSIRDVNYGFTPLWDHVFGTTARNSSQTRAEDV